MIIISVGSNLPGAWGDNPYEMCQKAFCYLGKKLNDTSMIVSPMYQTTPIPPSSQPLYINGVILFDSQIPCEDLLSILNDLEDKAGRIRQKINESRPLDLDIIAYHDKIITIDRAASPGTFKGFCFISLKRRIAKLGSS